MQRATRLGAVLLPLFLLACQTTGGSFCAIARPVRLPEGVLDRLSDADIERLLAFNEKGEKLCRWKP